MFSAVEHELSALIRMQYDLAGLGVRTWLPHEVSQVPDGTPLVVKPRYGQGSKGVYFCSERRQAAVLCELAPDPVIQERVPGREFTADCLAGRDGRASVILRWRLLVMAVAVGRRRSVHLPSAVAGAGASGRGVDGTWL